MRLLVLVIFPLATMLACASTPFERVEAAGRDYVDCLRDHADSHDTYCSGYREIYKVQYRTWLAQTPDVSAGPPVYGTAKVTQGLEVP